MFGLLLVELGHAGEQPARNWFHLRLILLEDYHLDQL